jgi:Urocanase Rossmann-like domain
MHDAPASSGTPQFKMPPVERVREHYGLLCDAGDSQFGTRSLAGRLLLIDGLAGEGDALLIAASIAGAASLVLETRADAVRHCIRNGIVDFAVTTLAEALRILKNEVRKQQPIAVLLEQDPAAVLAEMVERGAQPDMLRWPEPEPAMKNSIDTLRERGALPLPPPSERSSRPEERHSDTFDRDSANDVCWRAGEGGSSVLRQLDLLAGNIVPEQDVERQNWIARAPRYLPRALRLERRVEMTESERTAFLAAVEERAQQGALAAPVTILTGGQDYSVGR